MRWGGGLHTNIWKYGNFKLLFLLESFLIDKEQENG